MANLDWKRYQMIAEDGRELLRNDIWELHFEKLPSGIYSPPKDNIKIRLTDVSFSISEEINNMYAEVHGFRIIQPVTSNKADGSVEMRFNDREDMSIQYMFTDWANKVMEKSTKKTGRKSDLSADITFTQFNTWRQPIKKIVIYNAFPQNAPKGEQTFVGQDPQNIGEYSVSFEFEYHERTYYTDPRVGRLT